jgi:hypothetical protein
MISKFHELLQAEPRRNEFRTRGFANRAMAMVMVLESATIN